MTFIYIKILRSTTFPETETLWSHSNSERTKLKLLGISYKTPRLIQTPNFTIPLQRRFLTFPTKISHRVPPIHHLVGSERSTISAANDLESKNHLLDPPGYPSPERNRPHHPPVGAAGHFRIPNITHFYQNLRNLPADGSRFLVSAVSAIKCCRSKGSEMRRGVLRSVLVCLIDGNCLGHGNVAKDAFVRL
ncbi:hypothetical protein AVEN_179566-1 [Araneus ventricosus]|uniref:Uncharacterized protein n=1 Tax=Araneus ventricosus TaxID=182803 RepID=A0A4Y2BCL1_ARAVE|nr:hypothetical protein AVEN_179566-1 [Araneus ventricosus]